MLLNAGPPGPPTPALMTEEAALVRRQGQALHQALSIYNRK